MPAPRLITKADAARALVNGDSYDLAPAKRTVVADFCGPVDTGAPTTNLKNAFLVGPSPAGATLAEADFPTRTPSGKKKGTKIILPATANASVGLKSYVFAAGAFGAVPTTPGANPFRLGDSVSVGCEVYWPSEPVAGDEIRIVLHDGANSIQWQFGYLTWLKKGINWLTAKWDETNSAVGIVPTITGTINANTQITAAQIFVKSGAGALQPILGEVFVNKQKPAKGAIVFTFDGIYAAHQTILLPLLTARGIKATFTTGGGIILNSPAIFQALYAAGHDVGSQGYEHLLYAATDIFSTGQTPRPSLYDGDMGRGLMALRGLGFDRSIGVTSMPYNTADATNVATATAHGIRLMREAKQPRTPITDFGLATGQINVGQIGLDNLTLAQAQAAIDAAANYGEAVLFTAHEAKTGGNGSNSPGDGLSFYAETMGPVLDYALAKQNAGLIQTMTMSELDRSLTALKPY